MASSADFSVRREGEVVVADWSHVGSFRSDREPPFRPEPALSSERVRKMEEGPVRALQRYLAGSGTLHASAVLLRNAAVGFLGESGAGKSTTAAMLCAARGAELLADDALPIRLAQEGDALAEDGDTALWLLPPGAAELWQKIPSRPKAVSGFFPLKLLVRLAPASTDTFSARRLRGVEALRALAAAWMRFPLGYDERDFGLIAEFYRRVPLVELVRPQAAREEALLAPLDTVFTEFLGAPPHAG